MRSTVFGDLDVFDAHAHLFSHRFFDTLGALSPLSCDAVDRVARAVEITGFVQPPTDPAEFARTWVEELDRHHISRILLMSSVSGDGPSIAAAVAAFPDRIAGSFMLDPTRNDVVRHASTAFDELGLKVACLFPAMHRYSVAETEGARAVAAVSAERPGTAVFIHCGVLSVGIRKKLAVPSRFDLRFSNPIDVHPLATEFSHTRFIIPHFGAGMFREALMVADLCPNVYLDTSSTNRWMSYHAPALDLVTVFRRALDVIGPERLLFGSDSSFFPRGWNAAVFEAQVEALAACGVDREQASAIFGGNLASLLAM